MAINKDTRERTRDLFAEMRSNAWVWCECLRLHTRLNVASENPELQQQLCELVDRYEYVTCNAYEKLQAAWWESLGLKEETESDG